jgi:hypothetical protein
MKIDLTFADSKEFFDEYGFALFKNVFSKDEILLMRAQLRSLISMPSSFPGDWDNGQIFKSLRADIFNRNENLQWIFLKQELSDALRKVIGNEIAFVPEMVFHYMGFGNWHKDTTSQENANVNFHYEPDSIGVECAIYLQDNSDEFGGGLDVIPGSHKMKFDPFIKPKGIAEKIISKVIKNDIQEECSKKTFRIYSEAGDFIIFNKKLNHRSSPLNNKNVPVDKEKMALFFIAGVDNRHLAEYVKFIKTRPDYTYLKDYSYSEDFYRKCISSNIKLLLP